MTTWPTLSNGHGRAREAIQPAFQDAAITRPANQDTAGRFSAAREAIRAGLDVASGVFSAVSNDVETKPDNCGRYVSLVPSPSPVAGWDAVCALSGTHLDMTALGWRLFNGADTLHDPVFGYCQSLWAGHVNEPGYRARESPGGVAAGMADGIIHVKRSPHPGEPLFTYQVSRTADEIRDGAASKYHPVELSAVLREVREIPGRYALVGIPSSIFEARLPTLEEAVFAERLAWFIGLVRGHQKTAKWVESLARQTGIEPGTLLNVEFDKKPGPGLTARDYQMEFTSIRNRSLTTIRTETGELFGADCGYGLFKAPFSDYADDVFNEAADIVLGDAWIPPWDTDAGSDSTVIVRNKPLDRLLRPAVQERKLSVEPMCVEQIHRSQHTLIRHTPELSWRLESHPRTGRRTPASRTAPSAGIPLVRRLIQNGRRLTTARSHQYYKTVAGQTNLDRFKARMKRLIIPYDLVCNTGSLAKKTDNRFNAIRARLSTPPPGRFQLVIKRGVDMIGAVSGLIVLAPLFVLIAATIKATSPGPVFFKCQRVGRWAEPFTMIKFRTMIPDAPSITFNELNASPRDCHKGRDDPRVTRIGAILRRFSLDELPQLINVARGEMSLVGPRPHVQREIEHYTPPQYRRLNIKPGMTGLWQVSGRSDLTWDAAMNIDLHYIDTWTPNLDLTILIRTAKAIATGHGAY
jgi:lipopolysaccharide/colanic/teichoic acid biosynthesis glycosyltransferase/coenzyme F420-reducing hydrogenase beta subunit